MVRIKKAGRRAVVSAAGMLMGAGLVIGTGGQAHAESGGASSDEIAWCAMNFSCLIVNDATSWASSTAEWKYPESLHNGKGDAFRHCIWAGALANRVGYDRAFTQVMVHEDPATEPMNEVSMDVANDLTGLGIGDRSRTEGGSDSWGWIMSECATQADGRALAGLDGVIGAY
jgi:hypothetical protein